VGAGLEGERDRLKEGIGEDGREVGGEELMGEGGGGVISGWE